MREIPDGCGREGRDGHRGRDERDGREMCDGCDGCDDCRDGRDGDGPGSRRVRAAILLTALLAVGAVGCELGSESPLPPPGEGAEETGPVVEGGVVAAALASIDTMPLPWPFIRSFMVNATVRGIGDPDPGDSEVMDSPLDLLGLQERGYGICATCADTTRLAHAWVTLSAPVRDDPGGWLVPYTFSVRRWGTRSGRVSVRCVGGACRAVDGQLDSLEAPAPSCCPVFVREVRERR